MATWQLTLEPPPTEARALELWLQHAAGRILFEDVRAYAMARISPDLSAEARSAAQNGIDDALYGLMMVIDGATGSIANETQHVALSVRVQLVEHEPPAVVAEVELSQGDGMCIAYTDWLAGNFGDTPVASDRA